MNKVKFNLMKFNQVKKVVKRTIITTISSLILLTNSACVNAKQASKIVGRVTNATNLRTEAKITSKSQRELKSGEEFDIVGKTNSWYQVTNAKKEKGYINQSFFSPKTADGFNKFNFNSKGYTVMSSQSLNFSSLEFKEIDNLDKASFLASKPVKAGATYDLQSFLPNSHSWSSLSPDKRGVNSLAGTLQIAVQQGKGLTITKKVDAKANFAFTNNTKNDLYVNININHLTKQIKIDILKK